MVEAKQAWRGFWKWWLGELLAVLPSAVRGWLGIGTRGGWVLQQSGEWRVFRDPQEGSASEGPLDPLAGKAEGPALRVARSGVYIGLGRDMLLERDIELPLAAQENLREVLGYEMDRHTPFRSDQVWFDYRLLARDTDIGKLRLRLFVVPTHLLEDFTAALKRMHIPLRGVLPLGAARQGHLGLNLLPEAMRDRPSRIPQFLNLLLLLSLILLLGMSASLPLQRQQQVLAELQPALNSARAAAEETRRLRDELALAGEAARFMPQRLESRTDLLLLIDEVTRLLPDDTWLRQLELDNGGVRLYGESAAAATLVPLLESSPMFAEVGFRSPVTQDPRTGSERFQLGMRLVAPAGSGQ